MTDFIKLCSRFLRLTAARSSEARSARCDELDLASTVWTVPAERQRSHREYRVPVSPQLLALLAENRQHGHGDDPEDQSCE
ncbi:MAG: hypothetical protein OXC01_14215 [Immundisolibacterales bacterium]|nr:hypothetical protein [Immundisolibacterales bacterium]